MSHWLDGVPVFAERTEEVEARLYNLWRRARLHLELPLRLPLPELTGMVMLLDERGWVCVDERLNDVPVLAWIEFEDRHRDALHLPVRCRLNYYHYAASKIRAEALVELEAVLDAAVREAVAKGR